MDVSRCKMRAQFKMLYFALDLTYKIINCVSFFYSSLLRQKIINTRTQTNTCKNLLEDFWIVCRPVLLHNPIKFLLLIIDSFPIRFPSSQIPCNWCNRWWDRQWHWHHHLNSHTWWDPGTIPWVYHQVRFIDLNKHTKKNHIYPVVTSGVWIGHKE